MGYGNYLRKRTPRESWKSDSDHAADVIKNYFRHVGSSSRSSGRDRAIARKRMQQLQAAGGFTGPDEVSASQGSNMTFSQGPVSSMTTSSSAGGGGTIYTGTVDSNRQAVRAKRILRGVRASSTRPIALKAAMFLPGKGAEVDLIANNYLQPIIHKIPWKAPKLRYDGITSALENPKGNRVSMDFAFKMILECQKTGMSANYDALNNPNNLISTRFHCAHFFRHTNGNAQSSTTGTTAIDTLKWHQTLGPDASYIRLRPAAGGSYQDLSPFNVNYANTVLSPFRLPKTGTAMYTRVSLQALENFGWNLNPFKLTGTLADGSMVQNVTAFPNAAQQTQINASAANMQMVTNPSPSANKYISQHGTGGVRYNFSNDGTNAVTIECVIVAFKDFVNSPTATGYGLTNPYETFMKAAALAYVHRMNTKKGVLTLVGDPHTQLPGGTYSGPGAAIFSNAETEFVPTNIFPFIGKATSGSTSVDSILNPFKYVSRDQFIVGGGQSRIWKTSFPSDVYDASTDSPQLNDNVNSHSFMVMWSVCSAPLPCLEVSPNASANTSVGKIMLSREPQNCNVSCTGTYWETPTPVFAKIIPTPINIVGSLAQVTILPPASNTTPVPTAADWPAHSPPNTAGTIPVHNQTLDGTNYTGGLHYVDLPRSGQQPYIEPNSTGTATQVADTLDIGTLTTLQ